MKKKAGKESKVSTMYITETGKLFSEMDLEKYIVNDGVVDSKQLKGDVKWNAETLPPPYDLRKLMFWLDVSVVHASCVNVKVKDSVGIGYRLVDDEDSPPAKSNIDILNVFFNRVNPKEDILSVCKKIMLDYEACGNGYFEVARGVTEQDKIKSLFHVNATTMRLDKTKERWVQQVGQDKVYFKVWGDDRIMNCKTGNFVQKLTRPEDEATEIIQLKQYTYKSEYYGIPEWLPALYPMYGEMKEKEFNLDFFSNFGIPAYAVILEGSTFGDEGTTEENIKKYFQTEVKRNPHKTMVFSIADGAKLHFEQLSVDKKEASFRVYRKDNRDDILTAHHVPPYRVGIVEKGQLGGNVSEDTDRIYLDSVINPRQRDFTWVLNELIIKEGFGIEDLEFEFEDIDIRDMKLQAEIDKEYFEMGARTPNQILLAQGKEAYEGGDVYYVPSTMVPTGEIEVEKQLFKGEKTKHKEPDVRDYQSDS